ncbi:MAG TPA: alpha/beta fold hydrolase [Actinoplanes sp.]
MVEHANSQQRRRRRTLSVLAGAAVAVVAAALAVGSVPFARAEASLVPATSDGWAGIVRDEVTIPMDGGWVSKGELTYPRGAKGRLPTVVLLHGSGKNDLNETVDTGATPLEQVAQTANHQGFAVLRFNKRGVVDVGPKLSDNPAFLYPAKPYEQVVRDAAAAVRFAAKSSRVDTGRLFLFGHSEGTQVASNLAAAPRTYGIPGPAGVVEMGVVSGTPREVVYYQAVGAGLGQLHDEFDFDGDGLLTADEVTKGLLGQPAGTAQQLRPLLLDGVHDDKVNSRLDANGDGKLAIDAEVRPAVEAAAGFAEYPNLTNAPKGFADYLVDIARFPTPAQDLVHYHGSVLLLNGQTDIQTRVRGAIVTDAALTTAGNRDHKLITYPGMGHFLNVTPQYNPAEANPDPVVLADIGKWLARHR